jgi:hypothetical protein
MQARWNFSEKLIEAARSPVIVVNNAFVRILMRQEEAGIPLAPAFRFSFDEELGTELITAPKTLEGILAFFTSMLSG